MILHIVKCEMCNNQYRFDPLQKLYERDVPEEWLKVFHCKDMQGQAGWDFCSKACLMRWSSPLVDKFEIEEAKPKPIKLDHEPYPYCCPAHYPMPLTKQDV